ncbi:MAG TPA: DUF6493 family protein [Candidatus Obscuribacterales bacterium]
MKTEDLDRVLALRDKDKCVRFFAGASEADRRTVARRALQWYEVAHAFEETDTPFVRSLAVIGGNAPKRIQKALDLRKDVEQGRLDIPREARDPAILPLARLALLASAGLTDVRKAGLPDLASAFVVMRDRRPSWFGRWLDFACEREPVGAWSLVRQVELDGLAIAERGSSYWLSMALGLGQREVAELLGELKNDRELLECHLWRMLEEDRAMQALSDPNSITEQLRDRRLLEADFDWRTWPARHEQWRRASYIWKVALAELGLADRSLRDRLLEACFTWITRLSTDGQSRSTGGSSQNSPPAEWFRSIHDELNLSPTDMDSMLNRYVGLLSTKDSGTLLWSLECIGKCHREYLPVEDLLGCLPNVFYQRRKEPAAAALKLLEGLVADNPAKLEQIAVVVLDALDHTSSDIHKRALAILKRTEALRSEVVRSELKSRSERLSGLVKQQAQRLVPDGAESEASHVPTEDEGYIDQLLATAASLPSRLAEVAGIQAAVAAVRDGGALPPCLTLASTHIPRLDPAQRVQPLQSLDDLVVLFMHVLQGGASADDVERVLDGLMRLCHERPADFDSRVSSLRKKVDEMLTNVESSFAFKPFSGVNVLLDLSAIGRAWMDGKVYHQGIIKPLLQAFGVAVQHPLSLPGPLQFFSERAFSIANHVPKRRSLPLLSAPTHEGGWIDPLVLPERLGQWRSAGVNIDKADFIQALLRLAPDNRTRALELLPAGNEEYLSALKWALGGELQGALRTAEIWVAAFRCREPRGNSQLLRERFPGLGPDCAERATYGEKLKEYSQRSNGIFGLTMDHASNLLPIESCPLVKQRPGVKFFPTELLHDQTVTWDTSDVLELIWPLDRESYFAYQTRRMALYLDSQGTYWKSAWHCLFDPDVPTSGLGAWLIALALSAKQPEAARTGLDALIASIEDCRLDGTTFGTVLGKLLSTGKITLARWIRALRDVARISPLHCDFVGIALQRCLATLPPDSVQSPPIPMLELLYECSTASGASITDEAVRAFLQGISGKGKAAKLAKLLLELQPGKGQAHHRRVAIQLLESRVQRVKRWQGRLTSSASR